jgi:hypothetical protein
MDAYSGGDLSTPPATSTKFGHWSPSASLASAYPHVTYTLVPWAEVENTDGGDDKESVDDETTVHSTCQWGVSR